MTSAHSFMSTTTKKAAVVLFIAVLCGCRMGEVVSNRTPTESLATPAASVKTNQHHYAIRVGGSYVAITNAPSSNPVSLSFASWSEWGAVFRLTNAETHGILFWNVRVQVRSTGPGTDGFGWDTVYDDYPTGTPAFNSAHLP